MTELYFYLFAARVPPTRLQLSTMHYGKVLLSTFYLRELVLHC